MKSLTAGFGPIKDESLGVADSGIGNSPHYRHIRTCKLLCSSPPQHPDGAGLAAALVDQAEKNWSIGKAFGPASPSGQNWRFRPAGKMKRDNRSPEVTFERSFMGAALDDWANQVPTCAGVLRPNADGRRAIDLLQRIRKGQFDFIELKVVADEWDGSGQPLFAAMEILDYGVLYAFSRLHARSLGYGPGSSQILDAHRLGLQVLAPARFYEYRGRGRREPYELSWLESMMRDAAGELASRIGGGTAMDFRFDVFPDEFSWPQPRHTAIGHAKRMMERRRPLIDRSADTRRFPRLENQGRGLIRTYRSSDRC